jgi:hypothetical protein
MAESDPSPNCSCTTMTIPEVHSLADRLAARGRTVLTDAPEQQGDLRLAAKALRALTRAFHRSDARLQLIRDCAKSSPAMAGLFLFAVLGRFRSASDREGLVTNFDFFLPGRIEADVRQITYL